MVKEIKEKRMQKARLVAIKISLISVKLMNKFFLQEKYHSHSSLQVIQVYSTACFTLTLYLIPVHTLSMLCLSAACNLYNALQKNMKSINDFNCDNHTIRGTTISFSISI